MHSADQLATASASVDHDHAQQIQDQIRSKLQELALDLAAEKQGASGSNKPDQAAVEAQGLESHLEVHALPERLAAILESEAEREINSTVRTAELPVLQQQAQQAQQPLLMWTRSLHSRHSPPAKSASPSRAATQPVASLPQGAAPVVGIGSASQRRSRAGSLAAVLPGAPLATPSDGTSPVLSPRRRLSKLSMREIWGGGRNSLPATLEPGRQPEQQLKELREQREASPKGAAPAALVASVSALAAGGSKPLPLHPGALPADAPLQQQQVLSWIRPPVQNQVQNQGLMPASLPRQAHDLGARACCLSSPLVWHESLQESEPRAHSWLNSGVVWQQQQQIQQQQGSLVHAVNPSTVVSAGQGGLDGRKDSGQLPPLATGGPMFSTFQQGAPLTTYGDVWSGAFVPMTAGYTPPLPQAYLLLQPHVVVGSRLPVAIDPSGRPFKAAHGWHLRFLPKTKKFQADGRPEWA